MGTVFLARDVELERDVAIKVLNERTSAGSLRRRRLVREAKALAKLRHPNVVQVHEVGVDAGRLFVVMEHCPGETLAKWLEGRRSPDDVLDVMLAAGEGLVAAHSVGLVHRDFKPANVMVGEDGRVSVLDFGIAKGRGDGTLVPFSADESELQLEGALTKTGAVLGTPAYMSPEQHQGKEATPLSDQFSFGLTLFEGLYGVRPFDGRTYAALATAVIDRQFSQDAIAAQRARPIPRSVERAVQRALAGRPSERFADMQALLQVLRPRQRSAPRVALLGALAVGALGAGLWIGQAGDKENTANDPCGGAASLMAEVWNEDRSESLEAAISGSGEPWRRRAAEGAVEAFQAFGDEWAAAHRSACEDTVVRRDQSQHGMEARLACLRRAKSAFGDSLTTLEELGDEAAVELPRVRLGLPNLAHCAEARDITALYPEDPELAAQVEVLRADLDRAKALADRADLDGALAVAEQAQAMALELGFDPLIAEALHRSSSILSRQGRASESSKLDYQALALAFSSGHDRLALAILLRLSYDESLADNTGAGDRLGRVAEAYADAGSVEQGMALNNRGVAALVDGELDGASTSFNRAYDLIRGSLGSDDGRLEVVLTNLGAVSERQGDFRRAHEYFEEARRVVAKAYGDEHPSALKLEMAKANTIQNLEALEPALGVRLTLERAVIETWGNGPPALRFRLKLGGLLRLTGRTDAAISSLDSLLERASGQSDLSEFEANARLLLSMALLDRGDERGVEMGEQALSQCEETTGWDQCSPTERADLVGRLALLKGDSSAAVEALEGAYSTGDGCMIERSHWLEYALRQDGDEFRASRVARTREECRRGTATWEWAGPPDR